MHARAWDGHWQGFSSEDGRIVLSRRCEFELGLLSTHDPIARKSGLPDISDESTPLS